MEEDCVVLNGDIADLDPIIAVLAAKEVLVALEVPVLVEPLFLVPCM